MKNRTKMILSFMIVSVILTSSAFIINALGNGLGSLVGQHSKDIVQQDTEQDAMITISKDLYEYYRSLDELVMIMNTIENKSLYETEREKLVQGACKGMLDSIDDVYTFYYTPDEFQRMLEDDKGDYAGIGLQIQGNYETGICTVSRVFENTPAREAGLMKGDILYRVEDELYVNAKNLDEAVKIMRGIPGTPVKLTILRNGEEMTFQMNRADIHVNNVDHKLLDHGIGLIQIYQFAGESGKEFQQHFSSLIEEGAKSLILDLRDNPGGWVQNASKVCDLFCDGGELCYLVYRSGEEEHQYLLNTGKTELPIVILLNENSASASEVVSGCLKDRANATIVGTKSFGKGIVQQVQYVSFDGAGMQYTIAEYLTPNGNHIHELGIEPDVLSELPEGDIGMYEFGDVKDPQLQKAIEVMLQKMK